VEYSSNFKEKSAKETKYKIKLEKINEDGSISPASSYKGEFYIKMTSISPNYDFTVYNMKTEPQMRTSEKYFGALKSCYFACVDPETYVDAKGNYKDKFPIPAPVRIEMQRHHFNTPNLPAIFGLGALAGNPKGLNAVVWESVQAELSQHDFESPIADTSDMSIVFTTSVQKNTLIKYFGLSEVFAAIGGFLVSVKGITLLVYGFFFGKMIKKQFAKLLYSKNQKAIDDEK
jgi:hypothetical protein